ncbi:uncharacterized protein NPIL_237231 [Nephila pilipes]|uniref:Fibulin C-terminal Ig-like domain-containing protein n=1 Tax=Nephila pilipes TaxID=299642 RepID=A0A8X6NXJ5_NEPPI|nr:uncharacterized protein NPIL_237231 [Nephila pilipes]
METALNIWIDDNCEKTELYWMVISLNKKHLKFLSSSKKVENSLLNSRFCGNHQEVNSKDTIVCRKRCAQNDVDCILNDTQTITFQTLALPTVPYLPQPLILTTMRAVAMSGNVRFHTDYRILEGNERELFDILKGQGVGSLRLTRALHGPDELLLKILMIIHLNPNPRFQFASSTRHLAYIHVIVSEYDF